MAPGGARPWRPATARSGSPMPPAGALKSTRPGSRRPTIGSACWTDFSEESQADGCPRPAIEGASVMRTPSLFLRHFGRAVRFRRQGGPKLCSPAASIAENCILSPDNEGRRERRGVTHSDLDLPGSHHRPPPEAAYRCSLWQLARAVRFMLSISLSKRSGFETPA